MAATHNIPTRTLIALSEWTNRYSHLTLGSAGDLVNQYVGATLITVINDLYYET